MGIVAVYVGIYFCAFFVSWRSSNRLKKFLKKYDAIANEQVLQEFKSLVRREMYENLLLILLFAMCVVLSTAVSKSYGIGRQVIIYNPVALFGLHAAIHQKFEKQARSLPAATEELAQTHRQVSKAWKKRLLPNF